MRKTLMIAAMGLLLMGAAPASQPAEVSKEQMEAAHARFQAAQAATTQPATITNGELNKLRAELTSLRAENARLRAEITKLKAAQATAAPAYEQGGAGGPVREIRKAIAEHRLTNGMTVTEAEKALGVKFRQIADSSEGTTYRANVTDKARPNLNTGAAYTGTEYTISVRDGVISDWSSRRYFLGTDGLVHDQQ